MFLNVEVLRALIKERRKRENLSLRALAEISGVSFSTISRIEAGRFTPTYDNAIRLAKALGVSVSEAPTPSKAEHSEEETGIATRSLVTVGEIKRQTIALGRRKNLSKISNDFDWALLVEGSLVLQSTNNKNRKIDAGAKLDCHLLRQHTCWALAMTDAAMIWFRLL